MDSIEIQMGRNVHDRLLDLELDKADFAEIPPDQAHAERPTPEFASLPRSRMNWSRSRSFPAAQRLRIRAFARRLHARLIVARL